MQIALVLHRLDPRAGGVEHWTCQFAETLAAWGHEVHVVAERFAPSTDDLPIERHAVPGGASRWEFAEAAARIVDRLSLDVVHDTGAGWRCDVFQPHGGSRVASFEQNLLLLPPWMRPWKRAAARMLPRYREFERLGARQYARDGRLVLALSRMVAADIERYHGVPPERMRIVYNGVDAERFSPAQRDEYRQPIRDSLGLRDDDVLALIVAHNFELKGVPAAIRAVGRLAAEGARVRLAVVGGKRVEPYRRLARRNGARQAVSFLGSVADAAPYYAAADVYVQPTFYDPCSLVVLEALAGGLPVITSRFNGAGELMTDGVEGFVLDDPADDAALADRLRTLLDPQTRAAAGAAARRTALRHTWERNCREIVAVYEEVAARSRVAA